jgi:hypothetical protein
MMFKIGFDVDGVLADFSTSFREVEAQLFAVPHAREMRESAAADLYRRHEAVWQQIRATPNFWTTLKALDSGAVGRLHGLMLQHRWEVVFVTQRPETEGDTVQRQTQRWLIDHGFDLPSVVVISGSRGMAARALRLNYHVDDNEQHCQDVVTDSKAKSILVVAAEGATDYGEARKRGIGIAGSIGECLDMLDRASALSKTPSLLGRIAGLIGWR